MARVAPCFARRDTRLTCRDMVNGLLFELEDNCWTLAEAAGHASPYRMQHLLCRARCDERQMLDAAADWAAARLAAGQAGDDVVLIVDETADEKSSAEVYGGLELRRSIRERGARYVLAVRSTCMVTLPSGRHLTVKTAASLVKPGMWQRMRTGSATKGARDYHWRPASPPAVARLRRRGATVTIHNCRN